MKRRAVIVLSIFCFYSLFSQSRWQHDSTNVARCIKAYLYSKFDLGILSKSDLDNYFNSELKLVKLKTECLDEFEIYYVPYQTLINRISNDREEIINMPITTVNPDYKVIVAIVKKSGLIYCLHGPKSEVDLKHFIMNHLYSSNCGDCIGKSNKRRYSCFKIDGIDFPSVIKRINKSITGIYLNRSI